MDAGDRLIGRALRRTPDRPDAYAVQAAIAARHALAPTYADTSWDAVVSSYDVLLSVQNTPVVRLNRAVAVAERDGPRAGLALVDAIGDLESYPCGASCRIARDVPRRRGPRTSGPSRWE